MNNIAENSLKDKLMQLIYESVEKAIDIESMDLKTRRKSYCQYRY